MKKQLGSRWFRLTSLLVLMFFFLSSLGCAIQTGAGAAPSTIPITAADTVTELGETKGSDWAIGCFGAMQLWPTSTYDAIQKAKKKVGADALINVRVDNKLYWVILPIYPIVTVNMVYVKGMGAKVVRQGTEDL